MAKHPKRHGHPGRLPRERVRPTHAGNSGWLNTALNRGVIAEPPDDDDQRDDDTEARNA